MTTLIASLGQSPAVITETLDHLRDENTLTFDRLVLIAPGKLPLAQNIKQAGFLENGKDFSILESATPNPGYPSEVFWSVDYDLMTELDDVRTEEDAVAFYTAVLKLTHIWCFNENVYYAISGGRKSMSALMVLATSILPVKAVFHILLSNPESIQDKVALKLRDDDTLTEYLLEIEEYGEDSEDAETLKKAFHPGSDSTELVKIDLLSTSEDVAAVERLKTGDCIKSFIDVQKTIFNYGPDELPERNPEIELPDFKNDSVLNKNKFNKDIDTILKVLNRLWEKNRFIENAKCKSRPKPFWKFGLAEGGKFENASGKYEMSVYIPMHEGLSVAYHLHTTATSNNQTDLVLKRLKTYFESQQTKAPKKVLISTLGESPGIVTSAVHFYERIHHFPILFDKIVVIAPENVIIRQNCLDLLERQPCLKKSNRLIYREFKAPDVRSQPDLDKLLEKMKATICEYSDKGFQIYLNLAGGRKVMSGALLILAQSYEIEEAFHLSILDDELERDIERYGDWKKLKTLENMDRILYPDKVTALNLNHAIRT